jgi:hypothetical protein
MIEDNQEISIVKALTEAIDRFSDDFQNCRHAEEQTEVARKPISRSTRRNVSSVQLDIKTSPASATEELSPVAVLVKKTRKQRTSQ